MATATIPVDLRNPGQVFACLGFMEAAEILCGSCEGGFEWKENNDSFSLSATSDADPISMVLDFICEAHATEVVPLDQYYPSIKPEDMALPVILDNDHGDRIYLSHWADGSSRDTFKLYAGNRSAFKVVSDMQGLIRSIRHENDGTLLANPLGITCAMGGSFNFDARGAWKAIDSGYSPDRLQHSVGSSPIVHLLAAIGLEHARPMRLSTFEYEYWVWKGSLPRILARAALGTPLSGIECRKFRLTLFRPNPNSRAVAYAEEEFVS